MLPLRLADRLEYSTAADPLRNYCLWDCAPAAPADDKFRAVNLLYQSFDLAGLDARAYAIVDALRDGIGPFQTVFGVKLDGARLGWEFYFYDYQRLERTVSATRVLKSLAPFAPCRLAIDEQMPYFMFSLDLDDALCRGERAIDVVHLYIGNPGSAVSSGIAYAQRAGGRTLENFYFFFNARTELALAADKIACSAHLVSARMPVERVLVPELSGCDTICVANKATHDCVYFSGIDVGQLAWFLRWLDYPAPIRDFVDRHRSMLDHLRFDVGVDYRADGDRLQLLKSGYYGVF